MGGGRLQWMKAAATAAAPVMPVQKLLKWGEELKRGVWGSFVDGRWKPLAIRATARRRLRREVLLAGGEWPYDPPRKEMRTVLKGHKRDRISAERKQRTKELMEKMPQMIQEYRQRVKDRKVAAQKK